MPICWQVLSQGFKHHLEWCKGSRKETRGEESAEGEQEAGEDDEEDDPQQLAAIEASKVHCPGSSRQFLEHSQPCLKHMRMLCWKQNCCRGLPQGQCRRKALLPSAN